nr:MAG TPA: hypothetical protein [Caudoviricetes sp.]
MVTSMSELKYLLVLSLLCHTKKTDISIGLMLN